MWNLYYLYLSIVVHLRLIGFPDIELRWLSFNLRPHFLLVSTYIRGLLTDLDVNCNSGTLRSFAFWWDREKSADRLWTWSQWVYVLKVPKMKLCRLIDSHVRFLKDWPEVNHMFQSHCFGFASGFASVHLCNSVTMWNSVLSANETQLCDAFPRMPHQRVLVRRWPLLFGPDGIWGFF